MTKKKYRRPTFQRPSPGQLAHRLRLCVAIMGRMHCGGWVGSPDIIGIVTGDDRARGRPGCGFPL
jgi:hypothetical protein